MKALILSSPGAHGYQKGIKGSAALPRSEKAGGFRPSKPSCIIKYFRPLLPRGFLLQFKGIGCVPTLKR